MGRVTQWISLPSGVCKERNLIKVSFDLILVDALMDGKRPWGNFKCASTLFSHRSLFMLVGFCIEISSSTFMQWIPNVCWRLYKCTECSQDKDHRDRLNLNNSIIRELRLKIRLFKFPCQMFYVRLIVAGNKQRTCKLHHMFCWEWCGVLLCVATTTAFMEIM